MYLWVFAGMARSYGWLAHYCLELSELCKTDRVVPVVIFLHQAQAAAEQLTLGTELLTYLTFNYLKYDLASTNADDYLNSSNLVARINLPNMQWSAEDIVDIYASAINGLFSLEFDPEKQLKYLDFIDIYTALDDNQMQEYQARYPQENTKMARLTERLLNEGMEKGRQEGESSLLIRQLTRRFGPLDAVTLQRLQRASSEDLERWADNILDAKTLSEVFVGR